MDHMTFDEFKEVLAEDLKESLYTRGYEDVEIGFNHTNKANVEYEAMTIKPADSQIGINFNIEGFYQEYEKGVDYSELRHAIADLAAKSLDNAPEVNTNVLTDYEQMKDKLSLEVISKKGTPVFEGKNLLCSGVQIEAYSVEDKGKGISFNVYCYNVQPGVIINYSNGSNKVDPNYKKSVSADEFVVTGGTGGTTVDRSAPAKSNDAAPSGTTYVVNKNSKKFHNPTCDSVKDMKEKNKMYYEGTRDELIQQGYDPCKRCNP